MLNLSIMPLGDDHIEEYCEDIIREEKRGSFTHAMLTMYLSPEGTPPKKRAKIQCELFDKYRAILDPAGAKYGILVQSTLGHIKAPNDMHPFTHTVSLADGEVHTHTVCPLDEDFRAFMRSEMHELATHSPSLVMLDDDIGLIYRANLKGCACKRHMAEFNRRAGTDMTREELYAHTQGDSDTDKKYTSIYVETVRDSLIGFVRELRRGLDEVDPKIQGIVSGIYISTCCEFSGDIADAFAGEGNPRIARMNNGMYTAAGPRFFSKNMYRAAILRENTKDKIDIFLAETDTCPQNRYSTSAALLHAHFTGDILEGAKGAKHWITRMSSFEPKSGRAYRDKLSKYKGFYERVADYADEITPFGCRIPLTTKQDYGFKPASLPKNTSPWSTCVIERLGLPLYFSNAKGGAVFLDDFAIARFTDEEILDFLCGTVILSGGAAVNLSERGFGEYLGVSLVQNDGKRPNTEIYNNNTIAMQVESRKILIENANVEVLSYAASKVKGEPIKNIYPASVRFDNSLGGETVIFSGNPDTLFNYYSAFSFLSETRKNEFIDILSRRGNLPLYYPGDTDMYIRAGYTKSGKIFAALFNISLDEIDTLELVLSSDVTDVQKLDENGNEVSVSYKFKNGLLTLDERMRVLEPLVLIITV